MPITLTRAIHILQYKPLSANGIYGTVANLASFGKSETTKAWPYSISNAQWLLDKETKIQNLPNIDVVHFEYFRADAFGIFQLVPCVSSRNSYISYSADGFLKRNSFEFGFVDRSYILYSGQFQCFSGQKSSSTALKQNTA